MDFVGQHQVAICVGAEFILGIDQDQPVLGGHFLTTGKQPQGDIADLVPLCLG